MDSDPGEREVRAARNQAMFRAVNEHIRALNDAFGTLTETFTIACECFDVRCIEMIVIKPDAYEHVRSHPHRFAVRPGHLLAELENVVEETDTYMIVEKLRVAADEAEALDPRTA